MEAIPWNGFRYTHPSRIQCFFGWKRIRGVFFLQVRMTKVDPRPFGTATSPLGFMTIPRIHVTMANTNTKSSSWLVLAIASGACAAFNGVFAKLYASAFLTATHG